MKLINEKAKKIISVLITLLFMDIPLAICIFMCVFNIKNVYFPIIMKGLINPILMPILLLPIILYILFRILLFNKNKTVKLILYILSLLFIPISFVFYVSLLLLLMLFAMLSNSDEIINIISPYLSKYYNF